MRLTSAQPARFVSFAVGGVPPEVDGIGPTVAIPKALKLAGLTLDQIDLIELNEAFAAQALSVIRQAKLDPTKVNVNGGAIALGYPLGCTGAKLTVQLMGELARRNARYGMVTMRIGGAWARRAFLSGCDGIGAPSVNWQATQSCLRAACFACWPVVRLRGREEWPPI